MGNITEHFNSPTEICLAILALFCFITLCLMLMKFHRKTKTYQKIIALYIFLILFQIVMAYIDLFSSQNIEMGKYKLMNISAYIFVLLEFGTFCLLLKYSIHVAFIKPLLMISILIFFILSITIWVSTETISKALSVQSTFETILLLPICFIYFYLLLKNPPILVLTNEPYFWIVTGIFFLLICLTPFYLMISYFKATPEMQIVDHIAYMTIVSLFSKAFYIKVKEV